MSYARHQMPLLGRSDEGIWYGIGFGGHGVAPTSMGGEILADAILGKAAIPSAFSRYKPEPTFGVLGRIAAQLTYWTLQTKDWLRQ